jgi:hypothetical protein
VGSCVWVPSLCCCWCPHRHLPKSPPESKTFLHVREKLVGCDRARVQLCGRCDACVSMSQSKTAQKCVGCLNHGSHGCPHTPPFFVLSRRKCHVHPLCRSSDSSFKLSFLPLFQVLTCSLFGATPNVLWVGVGASVGTGRQVRAHWHSSRSSRTCTSVRERVATRGCLL